MTKTVPPTTDTGELTGYAVTAAELRRIADALDTLPGAPSHVTIAIQTQPRKGTRDQIAAGVDVVALAVLGEPGQTKHMSGSDWHHTVGRWTGGLQSMSLDVYQAVPGPPDERDAELERLRAENAELRVRAMPEPYVEYLRSVDNGGTSAEVPTGVEGGPVTGRATVADTSCLAVLRSGVRCDEPIYWNPAAYAWWHRDVAFFNHTATGPSVPPTGGE